MRRLARAFPDRATLETVLDLAARAPSRGNTQPWRWHVDARGVHLYANPAERSGNPVAERRDVLLGCGAVLHHCAVAFAGRGWRPRVHRFPTPGDDRHLAVLEVIEQPSRDGDAELAAVIPRRRADRRPFRGTVIPAGTLELLHIRAARRGVELAVVPRLRWHFSGDGGVALRFSGPSDGSTGDEHDDSVMLVLGTERDDDVMRLRAGEALSHVLLSATALGLATCPVTEPLDDAGARLALACEVFDGEAHPQVLIRVGVPASESHPLAPVERKTVSETTTWALAAPSSTHV